MLILKIVEAYRVMKNNFRSNDSATSNVLNKEDNPVFKTEDKLNSWVEYTRKMRGNIPWENYLVENEDEVKEYEIGDMILRSEFYWALKYWITEKFQEQVKFL